MRILIVSPKLPVPATDGGRIAILEPLKQLAVRGHHITLLALGDRVPQGRDTEMLQTYCEVRFVLHPQRDQIRGAARNLFSPLPYTVTKYDSPAMRHLLESCLHRQRFDIVDFETCHAGVFFRPWMRTAQRKVVIRNQNVESLLAHRYAATETGLRRAYLRLHAAKLARFEARVCGQVDLCVAITGEDAAALTALNPQIKTSVIPAGVDLAAYYPDDSQEDPLAIVFVGAMDWPPNADAALWFAGQVMPLVQRRVPQARFWVVGKNPPDRVKLLGRQGVTVTGYVEDVRPFLAKARVFVTPLRAGGGMRLKILQAAAMGKAVVSTHLGAEGLALQAGTDILIADAAPMFADQVCDVIADDALRDSLACHARATVRANYDWREIGQKLETLYQELLGA